MDQENSSTEVERSKYKATDLINGEHFACYGEPLTPGILQRHVSWCSVEGHCICFFAGPMGDIYHMVITETLKIISTF